MHQTMYRYLTFRVGGQRYGLQLDEVAELMPMLMLSELPGAAPSLVGLMAMSDGVVPVIDLRLVLGAARPEYRLDTPIITVRTAHGKVGLLVDDAETVESAAEQDAIPYQDAGAAYVQHAVRLPESLLLVLDIDRITAGAQTTAPHTVTEAAHLPKSGNSKRGSKR